MQDATLFPTEIPKYDPWVIREALHNCIAHQDYSLGGRINLVEKPDELIFTNLADFIPGSVEQVIKNDAPPERYRNPLLTFCRFPFLKHQFNLPVEAIDFADQIYAK